MKIDALNKRLLETCPEFFLDQQTGQSTSTQYAEFLPGAALSSDPSVSPWGQYGDRDIPLKRKTVVISFNNLEEKRFSELEEIHEISIFLKQAGFKV